MSTLNVLALLNSYIMKYNANSNNKASKSVSRALSVSLMPRALENSTDINNNDRQKKKKLNAIQKYRSQSVSLRNRGGLGPQYR